MFLRKQSNNGKQISKGIEETLKRCSWYFKSGIKFSLFSVIHLTLATDAKKLQCLTSQLY